MWHVFRVTICVFVGWEIVWVLCVGWELLVGVTWWLHILNSCEIFWGCRRSFVQAMLGMQGLHLLLLG